MLSSIFSILSVQEWIMVVSNFMFWQAIPLRTLLIYCFSIIGITIIKTIFKF